MYMYKFLYTQNVVGPVAPCMTCSSDTKYVIQLADYWTA